MIARAALVLALLLPAAAGAQDRERPAGWIVRPDDPAANVDTALRFVAMPPGWHVTTGPAVLLYDPASTVTGSFRVEAELYRFPGDSAAGYGIFLGGDGLDGGRPDYFAFLVDRDGRFELHHRMGDEIHPVVPRTTHPAVVPWTEGTAKNVLSAEVRSDTVRYFVNGQQVAAYAPQPQMGYDGIVGLRVGEDVDLHVTRLDVTPIAEPGGAAGNGAGIVRAREFQLVDADDQVRAHLALDRTTPFLRLLDDAGRVRLELKHDAEETAVYLYDGEGTIRIGVAQFAHGGGGVAIHGPAARGAAVLYYNDGGSLTLYSPGGEVLARVP